MNIKANNQLVKQTMRLALPIALQQLLTASLHLVDTAMVVSLGDISTAAIGAAGRWFFLIHLFFFGFGSGMSVIISQFWGIKDTKTIGKAFGLGTVNTMITGLLFTTVAVCFPEFMIGVFSNEAAVIAEGAKYIQIAALAFIPLAISMTFGYLMRSTEQVMMPLIISFVSVGSNTFLNYLLIYGKFGFSPLGIRGAAYATMISSTLQCGLYMITSRFHNKLKLSFKIKNLIPKDKDFVRKYYITAMPVLFNEVLWALGMNTYNMVLARQGSSNYAAYTIFEAIEQVAFTFSIGICSACSVILGKMVGKNELEKAFETARKYIYAIIALAVTIGGLLFGLSRPLVSLFNVQNANTASMAMTLLRIHSCMLILTLIPFICIVGIFRAGGDTKTGLFIDMFNVWVIGVPITLICGFVLKLDFQYIFMAMYSEHVIKVFMSLYHFRSKKWLNRLT